MTIDAGDLNDPEAWDDSALIDSWNEAFEEYKHYHSLHARGEKVEDVLRAVEEAELNGNIAEYPDSQDGDQQMDESVEDGEVGADVVDRQPFATSKPPAQGAAAMTAEQSMPAATAPTTSPLPPLASIPHSLLPSGQNDALKNLMMSWYYAGYYTGLHEGEQRAMHAQAQPPAAEKPA